MLAFARLDANGERPLVCVLNLSPVPRYDYRVGMPRARPLARGAEHGLAATTAAPASATSARVEAAAVPWHDQPFSALLTLPPLGAVWLVPE